MGRNKHNTTVARTENFVSTFHPSRRSALGVIVLVQETTFASGRLEILSMWKSSCCMVLLRARHTNAGNPKTTKRQDEAFLK
ncbi:hypothetical protein KIN20_021535 [Parelaphostrongylus tenuis]|uniref:Uncharacterized protein n=1 Tax=Parelaphostrongylus tenuis TaxID=148309 RepID=A0AAD5QU88_PARTN|nr:hypothetical protein KIN20_021535 [Parelaphostrongylus tenuis]